jgi:deoxyinosine 3'endonuclease (endonuclease V)
VKRMDIQLNLAGQVSYTNGTSEEVHYVVGTDISPSDDDGMAYGGAVVMGLPDLHVVEVKRSRGRLGFPYVLGVLSSGKLPSCWRRWTS